MKVPSKLSTLITKIDENIKNKETKQIVKAFHKYLIDSKKTEPNQRNLLAVLLNFITNYLESSDDKDKDIKIKKSISEIKDKQDILNFLNQNKEKNDLFKKQKNLFDEYNEAWKKTWNDYLERLSYFFRWYYNYYINKIDEIDEWVTPDFISKIKRIRVKNPNRYDLSQQWSKEELLSIIKYEDDLRNKAIITMLWDFNARNHEICRMKIKDIRFKDKYAEGEVPYYTKTGNREVLLRASFPYVRDWLEIHPLKTELNAPLICSHKTGKELHPDTIWNLLNYLKESILSKIKNELIESEKERKMLLSLINGKKWNPYCIRHSSIDEDGDHLTDKAFTNKVGLSPQTKRRATYQQKNMSNKIKSDVLKRDGINVNLDKPVNSTKECPRCSYINGYDVNICKNCTYALSVTEFNKIKEKENSRFDELEKRLAQYEYNNWLKDYKKEKIDEIKIQVKNDWNIKRKENPDKIYGIIPNSKEIKISTDELLNAFKTEHKDIKVELLDISPVYIKVDSLKYVTSSENIISEDKLEEELKINTNDVNHAIEYLKK